MTTALAALPFVLQGAIMAVDEFYCHRRRLLRRWERVGHPVDTIVFLSALAWAAFTAPSVTGLWVFGGLTLLSCLMITKDEWQHRELCTGFENWLHSLLFVIHPVVLFWAGYLWWFEVEGAKVVLTGSVVLVGLFFVYQTIYWNFLKNDQQRVL